MTFESPARAAVRLAREAAWAPLAVLVLHALLGRLFGHEPYVDPVAHFTGGLAAAYFFWRATAEIGRWLGKPTTRRPDLVALVATCAVALLWELGEFLSDRLFLTHIQHSFENTTRDVMLGVSGAIVYLMARRLTRRSNW